MNKKNNYVVLGAGCQGTALAYDMARWGEASKVILADVDLETAEKVAARVNKMLNSDVAETVQVDVSDRDSITKVLEGIDACLSAVPYYYNLGITEVCVKMGVCMCDLGGNTDIARQQQGFDTPATLPNYGHIMTWSYGT